MFCAETTAMHFENDLLSQALNMMRITGSLLLVEDYSPPWAVRIPDKTGLTQLLKPPPDTRIAAFHFVHSGGFILHGADQSRVEANSGDVIVSFGGIDHTIGQGSPPVSITLQDHLAKGNPHFHSRTDKAPTGLVCGVFLMHNTHLNPLFTGLPNFLHLAHASLAKAGVSMTIPTLLIHEIAQRGYGSSYAVQRLLELMCVDILRTYLLTLDETISGWLRIIKDPTLGKALYRFHDAPGEAWSVGRLAAEINLSPSRFAARFAETLGESCMTYVTKWRLTIACNLLQMTNKSVDEIAHQVGYENMPAFTRVFKRYVGTTPTQWRRQQVTS